LKLREALVIGGANKLARRMSRHNGYKTLGEHATLAQLHPSTARIAPDDDGLLPEWVVYNEMVATAKTFLSKVCRCRHFRRYFKNARADECVLARRLPQMLHAKLA
jgi:ATP-dependent RNA helicase DHX8/PRP22